MRIFKKLLKSLLILIGVVLTLALVFLGYLSLTEYKPAVVEILEIGGGNGGTAPSKGDTVSVLTFNIGYCGLSETEDFFMDGGKGVNPETRSLVEDNLAGVRSILAQNPADIYLIQEVDVDSSRSFGINEYMDISEDIMKSNAAEKTYSHVFAANFKCAFVPFPLPPIGRVDSGLMTLSSFAVSDAERHSLPVPFNWPVRMANLKRCMLVERVPLAGGGSELVVINVHLEAYDDGEGKAAQTKALLDFIYNEYAKGNYVLVGGDFNQRFPGADFPLLDKAYWAPPPLEDIALNDGWRFVSDVSKPSSRLLNEPYVSAENPQYYVIDGFLLSPNLSVKSVQSVEAGFKYSDHNPVSIELSLD